MKNLQRILKRSDFLAVARGYKQVVPGLILQMRCRHHGHVVKQPVCMRIGLTVTKKIGNAVKRNRVKRRLRVVVAQILPSHGQFGFDYVVIGRGETLYRSFSGLIKDLKMALRRIHKQQDKVEVQEEI